jgi:hypothetical protein
MSESPPRTGADDGAARLLAQLDDGGVSHEVEQRLLAALVARAAARRREGAETAVPAGAIAVEDALLFAADLLRSADVTSFELAALFDV